MSPYIPRPGQPVGLNPDWHLARPDDAAAGSRTIELPTAASTFELGRDRLAPLLDPGDLVVVAGPLGVGKTALIQGVGAGLRVGEPVLSPTFVIARVHRGGRIPLVHVDAYRLSSVREIDDLDLDADLDSSVTAVEWGQGLVEHLSDEHLLIELSLRVDSESRTATLSASGASWNRRLSAIMEL